MITVSIAIPCYKSSDTIEKVVSEIIRAFEEQEKYDYQIILVNDYPADQTFSIIKRLCQNDRKIIGLNLSKNFGQTSAKMAAIPYAKGDVLVFMDDDGQHPVEGIFALADKILEGYDIVYAYFKNKKHSLFKRITSRIHSKLCEINGIKKKGIHISSFFAVSKFAIDTFREYDSPFPSMGAYLNSVSDKATEIEMPHKERAGGKSGYTFKKLWNLWLNSYTNFSITPLRFIMAGGCIISLIGFVMGLVKFIIKLITPQLYIGYSTETVLLLLIGGLILLAVGFVGEYIGRIYMTISHMKPYKIREAVNAEIDNQ
ncbi:MAG: glycosyltransferase family 2 protein [Ruminococcus sp.]|nr:glycosyltransferase family 2 protein [Ruminococcus sp.]